MLEKQQKNLIKKSIVKIINNTSIIVTSTKHTINISLYNIFALFKTIISNKLEINNNIPDTNFPNLFFIFNT